MKITIKTQDIELDYEDGFSKIEANTVQNINALIEKIQEKKHKCEYCGAQSGLVVENKIKNPVVFGVPNNSTGNPVPPTNTITNTPPNSIFLGGVQYTNTSKNNQEWDGNAPC